MVAPAGGRHRTTSGTHPKGAAPDKSSLFRWVKKGV